LETPQAMPKRTDISSILIIVAISLCGCAEDISADLKEISRIEGKCGLKTGSLSLDAKAGLKFNPEPNEKYAKIDCALTEIKTSGLSRHMKYGFVGNEGPAKEEQK
jgi:hypothetical protein